MTGARRGLFAKSPFRREIGLYAILLPETLSDGVTRVTESIREEFARLCSEPKAGDLPAMLIKSAETKGATLAQIAIAWVLSRGKDIVPIIGARRRQSLAESHAALDVVLSPEDLLAIETALPKGTAAGSRYTEAQMAHLDSERG